MSKPRSIVLPLIWAILASLSTPAFSQPEPGSPEATAQAEQHVRRAKALFKAGSKEEARELVRALRIETRAPLVWRADVAAEGWWRALNHRAGMSISK